MKPRASATWPGGGIPPHREDGTLPIFRHGQLHEPRDTSPFRVSVREFVERFATSPRRVALLRGFFEYRERLVTYGLVSGFQWVGGSFLERRPREPEDIDLVTFFLRPQGWRTRQEELSAVRGEPTLFEPSAARARYGCDAFFVDMQHPDFMPWFCQWYAVYSHDKVSGGMQKGFLQIPLATRAEDDQDPRALLAERARELGVP
jgi:hypothetical protein